MVSPSLPISTLNANRSWQEAKNFPWIDLGSLEKAAHELGVDLVFDRFAFAGTTAFAQTGSPRGQVTDQNEAIVVARK